MQITVLLRIKAFKISLWDFPTIFRTVISPLWNLDDLVILAIYVFSILSITDLKPIILRRQCMINFSIKLSYFI